MKIYTLGKVSVTEVALEKVEIMAVPGGGAMEGVAHLVLKTSHQNLRLPPVKMAFVPETEFLESILQEAVNSIGLGTKKIILPSE